MKLFGNRCFFYGLHVCNLLLLVCGICITILGLYECALTGFSSWFDLSLVVYGVSIMIVSIYLYFTKFVTELISLYLSGNSILISFQISFSIGITVNDGPGNIHKENKVFLTIFMASIGAVMISCFILGYLYRNTLHERPKLSDRMISLQYKQEKIIN